MKILSVSLLNFTGKRQDRKTVEQLKSNNPYDLNVINQRNISQSIDNLSQVPGEDNVKFLLDVSKKLKYGTNIDLGKAPFNDWQVKLNDAARKSIEISPAEVQPKLYAKLDRLETAKRPLTATEQKILELRKSITENVDRDLLNSIENENIKNLDRNLDYFITSSEVPIAQKLYILKKLDYLMSPKYKINEQLADKKTQVLAEIVNDIVINTPESKIPNIKAINQLRHGMCAAISICRKALAYEDKPHFVDIILSELDNKPEMKVFDISQLGSNAKISVPKPYIDFKYAMERGYRIIDASALNWMNIANTTGRCNEEFSRYIAFDKEYFDTFSDIHIFKDINDELAPEQDYYRALLRSKATLKECKKDAVLREYNTIHGKKVQQDYIYLKQKYSQLLAKHINDAVPDISSELNRKIVKGLLSLEVERSSAIDKADSSLKKFMYLENEPDAMKLGKIKEYISSNIQGSNLNNIDKIAPEILDIVSSSNKVPSQKSDETYPERRINKARDLYEAAAAYRMQYDFGLESQDRIREMSKVLNIPDRETLIIQNLDNLIHKLQKGTLNPEIKEALMQRFIVSGDGNPDEMLIDALKANKETFEETMSGTLDSLYAASLYENRKTVLLNTLKTAKSEISEKKSKTALESLAKELNLPLDKRKVLGEIDKYIEILSNEKSTQEQYIEIYNKLGGRNQIADFKSSLENVGKILYSQSENFPVVVKGFNLVNGLPEDAPIEKTFEAYQHLADSYGQLNGFVTAFQDALEVRNSEGDVLNTVVPKTLIMKKLEDAKEIVSEKDLRKFQEKFVKIDRARHNADGTPRLVRDLPFELINITPSEKEVLKNIENHINNWYSATTRNLTTHHKEFKEPLDELAREIGVTQGLPWITEGHSGLFSNAQVKIFEHMTGRPYYLESNTDVAINKIKKSPYSGISSMSMKSDEPAMHAQYIVDLKPVKVKTADGIQEKDSLFHDNSWGPREKANVWVDENGLIRTDYSIGSGGKLGFITDSHYRSGKLLENLIDDVGEFEPEEIDSKMYKKLNLGKEENYKFRMFNDIITPGISPRLRSTISSIKDNTTVPADTYFEDLEKYAKSMTRDELLQKIKNIELSDNGINDLYENIEDRVWGKIPGEKEIATKEDFANLKPDDKLKVLFEKVAILQSYYAVPELTKIYSAPLTPENLKSLKGIIEKEARKNFDYTFGKSPDIANGGAVNSANEVQDLLVAYQRDTRVKISTQRAKEIVNSLAKIDKSKFDGSLDNTIELMLESFKNAMIKKTLNCENKEQKINELVENVRAILRKNMYFNKADMNSIDFQRDNLPAIEKWIDDNFDPVDDDEFVKIYNNMQNMTTAEFKEKYNYLINDKALGIKPLTGYDMLKKFRALDTKTENVLYNTLYFNEHYKNIEPSRTNPIFRYGKLSRVSKGATYVDGKRSFDDIYSDYYYSLKMLTLDKIYGKYKDDAYRKYGSLPAYVKVQYENKEALSQDIIDLYRDLDDSISTIVTIRKMLSTFDDMKNLQKFVGKIRDNATLTEAQHDYIMNIIMKFHNDYIDDNSLKDENALADEIIVRLNEGKSLGKDYKNLVNNLATRLLQFETTSSGTPISETIKIQLDGIKQEKFSFIMQVVDPKYHKTAFELLNKWIKAKSKEMPDADIYFVDFETFIEKHKMINSPEQMLKDYLLMLAKPDSDSKSAVENQKENLEKPTVTNLTESQQKELEKVKEIYQEGIASLLVSANLVELQSILMRTARQGHLNMLKDELKNTQLKLTNGRVVDLYSDAGLSIMLKDMYDDEDMETALMFIDQLGIGERVIEMYNKIVNINNTKRSIKRIHSVLEAVDKQVKVLNKEVEKLADIDSDPNYIQRLEEVKDKLHRVCMRTNFRATVKNIDKIMDALIEELKKNPNQPKYKLIKENTDYLRSKNIQYTKSYVEALNSQLQQVQAIAKLVRNIELPRGSKTEKIRTEFFDKIDDVQQYSLKYAARFDNISLATQIEQE